MPAGGPGTCAGGRVGGVRVVGVEEASVGGVVCSTGCPGDTSTCSTGPALLPPPGSPRACPLFPFSSTFLSIMVSSPASLLLFSSLRVSCQ